MNMRAKEGASSLHAQTACVCVCVCVFMEDKSQIWRAINSLVWSEQQEAACSDKAGRQSEVMLRSPVFRGNEEPFQDF